MAGKELVGPTKGDWVRPVSARPSGELYEQEISYSASQTPSLLDIVQLQLKAKRPHDYQTENHIIDDSSRWIYKRRANWDEVVSQVEEFKGTVWDNGYSSCYGVNDQVPVEKAPELAESLALISVDNLEVKVEIEWPQYGGRRKVRGIFYLNRAKYVLSISDPLLEDYYLRKADGTHSIGPALLCISLAEPFKGNAYKVIAGVIMPPR